MRDKFLTLFLLRSLLQDKPMVSLRVISLREIIPSGEPPPLLLFKGFDVIVIAGSIVASRLLVNRDIKLRKNPGDDDEVVGFFFSVVLLNFDNSFVLLPVGTTDDDLEKIYADRLLKPGFDFVFDGMLINYAIKKLWN